jgi:hypothetical protein
MQTFNQSLATLYFKKQITLQLALSMSSHPDELQDMTTEVPGSSTCPRWTGRGRRRVRRPTAPVSFERFRRTAMRTAWKGRTRSGRRRRVLVATPRTHAAFASNRSRHGRDRKGKEFALPKMGRSISRKEIAPHRFSAMIDAGLLLVMLEIPVLSREPGLPEDPSRCAGTNRAPRWPTAAQASEGLRRPLLQHGRRR